MAGIPGIPGFHNISMPLDVDNELQITPRDALVVINQINNFDRFEGEDAVSAVAVAGQSCCPTTQ